eukprot:CAMPEP_0170637428 /NCGR_PEP_ID=MMETSP0224-20130122/38404_1 /TAXON_ID=285029 /ORGANISM="Togula jolla, Strain CCCM 725" /LENGTH=73 /DNA_ID=CAMNT_0010967303 /DNA_START=13 /DNA_END=232 /DNA_ORIENTATION=+
MTSAGTEACSSFRSCSARDAHSSSSAAAARTRFFASLSLRSIACWIIDLALAFPCHAQPQAALAETHGAASAP